MGVGSKEKEKCKKKKGGEGICIAMARRKKFLASLSCGWSRRGQKEKKYTKKGSLVVL
jgi:hypothetical protein